MASNTADDGSVVVKDTTANIGEAGDLVSQSSAPTKGKASDVVNPATSTTNFTPGSVNKKTNPRHRNRPNIYPTIASRPEGFKVVHAIPPTDENATYVSGTNSSHGKPNSSRGVVPTFKTDYNERATLNATVEKPMIFGEDTNATEILFKEPRKYRNRNHHKKKNQERDVKHTNGENAKTPIAEDTQKQD